MMEDSSRVYHGEQRPEKGDEVGEAGRACGEVCILFQLLAVLCRGII